jgi:hypothetical protein
MRRFARYWLAGLLVLAVAAILGGLILFARSDSASVGASITSPDDLTGFYYKAVYINEVKLPPYPPGRKTRTEHWEQKPDRSMNQYLESTKSTSEPRPIRPIGYAPDLGPLPVQGIDQFFSVLKSTSPTPYILQYAGTEAVAGAEATVYRLYDPNKVEETLTYWIDEDAMFLLAYVHDATTVRVTLRIEKLEYNPDFAPGRFMFELPPDAEKLEPQ